MIMFTSKLLCDSCFVVIGVAEYMWVGLRVLPLYYDNSIT